MNQNEFETLLRNLINEVLDEKELNVIKNRYGLDCDSMSIKKAEKTLGIPASQIRALERKALNDIVSSTQFNNVIAKLKGVDLNQFMSKGVSGYYLLAIQLINNQ